MTARSEKLAEKSSQLFPVIAAEGQFGAVPQPDKVVAMEQRLQFLDAIEIDHCRTMDTQELCGIQAAFNRLQSFTD